MAVKTPEVKDKKELLRGHKAGKDPVFHPVEVPTREEVEEDTKKLLEEMTKDLEKGEKKKDEEPSPEEVQDSLARYVKGCFDTADRDRRSIEYRWLEDLRQERGEYAPEILERMDPNRSKAYIRLTRTKVKTVDSRLTDFLCPANGEKNWAISPTPLPDVSQDFMKAALAEHIITTGSQISPEEFEQLLMKKCTERANRMSKLIEDQLIELRYRDVLRETIHSGNLYGTGILKGPMVSFITNKQYKKDIDENGYEKWHLDESDSIMPQVENVSVWDFYPDMSATKLEDCRFMIQRHKMDKHELSDLSRRSDFRGKALRRYLRANPDGDYENKWFECQLHAMGDQIETGAASVELNKKYEVLEFWGYIDAEDLQRAGVTVPDKLKGSLELCANIWVLGNKTIKAELAPLDGVRWPYYLYYYDKDETSIFGWGIPYIMRDPQELVNSAFRAMLDNAAITAGPQIEVNLDLISEDEDPTDVRPFKIWARTGTGLEAQAEAIRVMPLQSYTSEYLKMIEAFERYSDEVTTIPRYMWGDQAGGAGRTASGLSMMMGSANITIKDQVKNFDDGITKPFITALYHWNMQFGNDEGVKGDYAVKATGSASLVAKEVYANSLMQFANITNNNVDLPVVKRAAVVRNIADALDLGDKDLVLSDKEIELANQQQAENAQKEREFMLRMVETAREYGISPNDMIENMRLLQSDIAKPAQQQEVPDVPVA